MSDIESGSFIAGQIEFFGADDPRNFRGTSRVSLPASRFKPSGIQEYLRNQVRNDIPRSIHMMRHDRGIFRVDSQEFTKAKYASPRGQAEFIEVVSQAIATSKLFCIEEGEPILESPTTSSPGGPQTLFEAETK